MKHEPDVSKKDQKMFHQNPHLGHAAGDYEPLQHPERLLTSEKAKQKKSDSRKVGGPNFYETTEDYTSSEQMDESLHLLMAEELHFAEIEQIRASYGTQGLDRQ